MSRTLRAATVALMCTAAAGAAWAGQTKCAKPEELSAMQTAAIQQELMVAALTCKAISLYNSFVLGYQTELQASDKALQKLFVRLRGAKQGTADYHSFKTRLANGSSMKSIHDLPKFCAEAQAKFDTALGPAKSTLAAFLTGQPGSDNDGISACPDKVITAKAPAGAKKKVAKKPSAAAPATVIPAQGGGDGSKP